MIVAVRGATTVEEDSPELIQEAVGELFSQIIFANGIREDDVINIFISVTGDIHSYSPAQAVRMHSGWAYTPIMSAIEPDIIGLPRYCMRILIQMNSNKHRTEVVHTYLKGASELRPDLKGMQ